MIITNDFIKYKKQIKNLIKPLDLKFKDLDIIEYSDDDIHRAIVLNETRIIEKYAYIPYLVRNKFRWFKRIKLLERKRIISYKGFDCGWTYMLYLKEPKIQWKIEEIL